MKNLYHFPAYWVRIPIFAFLLLLVSMGLAAQERTITGIILSSVTNEPIPNASVRVKGSSIGVSSSQNGSFKFIVPSNSSLIISSIGFKTVEVRADFSAPMTVVLAAADQQLTEMVVVGYGTRKRSDITGSVSSVSKERLTEIPVTNALQAIQGAVAGVNVTQNSSVPGSAPTALVRGVNSISASTSPFIVVDGIPFVGGSINDINPADIASIDILKDVSSVAIYGTRGANGVILITTKRGRMGKASISYNFYTGPEGFSHSVEPLNPAQYLQKYADYKTQAGIVNPAVLPNAYELANNTAGTTTNWLQKVSQPGIIQDNTVSIAGGNKDVRYYVSADYFKEKGVIQGYQYHRISLRSNLDANITDYLTAGLNISLTANNDDGGRASLTAASQTSPFGTFKNPNGNYTIYPMFGELLYLNPMLGLTSTRNNRSNNINTNAYAEFKPGGFIKGFKYRVNASYTDVPAMYRSYAGRTENDFLGTAQVNNSSLNSWLLENIFTYEKNWKKAHLDLTGLYSAQQTQSYASGTTAVGFINDVLQFNNLGSATTVSATSYAYRTNLLSQMLRLNYTYDSRYLFTATARRDGYSAFGSNTSKYGLFPSAALGWNISNEKFMSSLTWIDNLKLRASYGLSGNQAISPNATSSTSSSVLLPYNGLSTVGVAANVLGNNNLTWENTYGGNLGIDFSIINSRISGTAEVYNTKTKNLLLYRSLPAITGYTQVLDNVGKVSNRGVELSLKTVNIKSTGFRWETSINFSANVNKILDLYGDGKSDIGNQWFIGKPVNVIYDYKLTGVWQVGQDASGQDPIAKPGDLKFADLNGDKKITAADKSVIGQTMPKWIGGITNTFHLGSFNLNIFIQTSQGVTKNNSLMDFRDLAGRQNLPASIGYWTAVNQSNTRPALTYTNSRLYGYASNASYTRLKDATLSYVFSRKLADKLNIGGATIYISGRNLMTWTKWTGWDPEADYDRGVGATVNSNNSYPLVRSYIMGVNLTLR